MGEAADRFRVCGEGLFYDLPKVNIRSQDHEFEFSKVNELSKLYTLSSFDTIKVDKNLLVFKAIPHRKKIEVKELKHHCLRDYSISETQSFIFHILKSLVKFSKYFNFITIKFRDESRFSETCLGSKLSYEKYGFKKEDFCAYDFSKEKIETEALKNYVKFYP